MKNVTRTLFFLLFLGGTLTLAAQEEMSDEQMMQEDMSSEESDERYRRQKDMWEISPHAGIMVAATDMDNNNIGFGGGIAVRKALDNLFSIRVDALIGTFSGDRETPERSYTNNWISGTVFGVFSLNNMRFDRHVKKVDIYAMLGAGGNWFEVTDVVNENANAADIERETDFHGAAGAGIAFKLSRRINLGVETQVLIAFGNRADRLDAFNTTNRGFTPFRDVLNYTNLRLNINLGNFDRRTEPRNWIAPMDMVYDEMEQLREQVAAQQINDSDGDGVIDRFDEEPDTDPDAMVDTRGRTLDSDGDGIPDHEDAEPYGTPGPGERIDDDGRVVRPVPLTRDDVQDQIDASLADMETKPDVFFPMVHFDLNSSTIRYADYGTLSGVGQVMRQDPDLRVVVLGFTDQTGSDEYNNRLSYRRAKAVVDHLVENHNISRDRLILQYGGQGEQLVPENQTYMNRRVEFAVAEEGDEEMDPPSGEE